MAVRRRIGNLVDTLLKAHLARQQDEYQSGLIGAGQRELAEYQAEVQRQAHEQRALQSARAIVPLLLKHVQPKSVIDIGCGHGHAANLIADAFPASRVTGIDISEEGIAAARAEAERLRLGNVGFELRDAVSLEPNAYDLVTAFDVIHDLPKPAETLEAIHAALRPGGVFLMVDMAASSHVHENLDHPLGPVLYTASIFHCMTVSLAEGGLGLGTAWGERTVSATLAPGDPRTLESAALRLNEALAAFQQAVRFKPDYAGAHYQIGWIHNDQKNYDDAINSLKLALTHRSASKANNERLEYLGDAFLSFATVYSSGSARRWVWSRSSPTRASPSPRAAPRTARSSPRSSRRRS